MVYFTRSVLMAEHSALINSIYYIPGRQSSDIFLLQNLILLQRGLHNVLPPFFDILVTAQTSI